MMHEHRVAVAVLALMVRAAAAQEPAARSNDAYPPVIPGANVEVYKTVGDVKLNMYIFYPQGHRPTDQRPAIVFFFGGGWRSGNPRQFANHGEYFASRGMVAMAADYRVSTRHNARIADCVEDAKSAVRWIRANARRLGVDPNRLTAGGGSAGGHLAAATATLPGFDAAGENPSISAVPNALVLFNPALVLSPVEGVRSFSPEVQAMMTERAGVDPKQVSPYHHLRKGIPPAIIFHGKADTTVPYQTAEVFCGKMKELGNRCELLGFEGEQHGFFNFGRSGNKPYHATLKAADEFLTSLGYLKGAN